jgi:hypothetical protein
LHVKQSLAVIASVLFIFKFIILAPHCHGCPQAHAWSTTIPVNEGDAGGLKGAPDHLQGGPPGLSARGFDLMDGDDPHTRLFSELLLAPSQKAAGSAALFRSDHGARDCQM